MLRLIEQLFVNKGKASRTWKRVPVAASPIKAALVVLQMAQHGLALRTAQIVGWQRWNWGTCTLALYVAHFAEATFVAAGNVFGDLLPVLVRFALEFTGAVVLANQLLRATLRRGCCEIRWVRLPLDAMGIQNIHAEIRGTFKFQALDPGFLADAERLAFVVELFV